MLLALFALTLIFELAMYFVPALWRRRRLIAPLLVIGVGFVTGALLVTRPNIVTGIFFIGSCFRVINFLRIIEGRMHPDYLYRVTRRTGMVLMAAHAANLGVVEMLQQIHVLPGVWWMLITLAELLAGILVFSFTAFNAYKTRQPATSGKLSDKELPTVTIAIPARNETDDLEACLRSILANSYPKLEILVLDDCSQDRTPEVIRSFAHDGVRFVPGEEPNSHWLAKNQAYDKLTAEASGEYIIFCGVDVRFGPDAIRSLVTSLLERQKKMISILPLRTTGSALNTFFQPTRYWWELALPRKFLNRPAVLSTCWIIERQALKKLGGFGAVSHAIIPEGFFARQLIKTNEYSFARAGEYLDIQTRKKPADQQETAIRVHYPQIRRRPEMAYLLTLIDLGLLVAPVGIFIAGFWVYIGPAHWLAGLATLFLVATHVTIIRISNPANTMVAFVNYPLAMLLEMSVGLISMWQYEFSTVEWKGRNICIPVMHVIPRLPNVDSTR